MHQKYRLYGIKRIGYVDIENTNLDPEFGNLLTVVLLVREIDTFYSHGEKIIAVKKYKLTREDINSSLRKRTVDFDRRILTEFLTDLKSLKIDLLIGHYSVGWGKHDIPFLRSRALIMGLDNLLPKHKTLRYGDTWKMSHTSIKVHSYRLDAISAVTGSEVKKTRIEESEWQLARFGDPKAMAYVLDHNIKDVKLTYQVHKKIEAFNAIPTIYV